MTAVVPPTQDNEVKKSLETLLRDIALYNVDTVAGVEKYLRDEDRGGFLERLRDIKPIPLLIERHYLNR